VFSSSGVFGEVNEARINEYVEKEVEMMKKSYEVYNMSSDELSKHVKDAYALDKEMFATLTEEEQEIFISRVTDIICEMREDFLSKVEILFDFDVVFEDSADYVDTK
jgi:hypothetical protein